MNVEIKRFSDSDEDFAKATECRKSRLKQELRYYPLLFSQKNSLLRTLAYPLIHTPLDANLKILLEMSAGPAQKMRCGCECADML